MKHQERFGRLPEEVMKHCWIFVKRILVVGVVLLGACSALPSFSKPTATATPTASSITVTSYLTATPTAHPITAYLTETPTAYPTPSPAERLYYFLEIDVSCPHFCWSGINPGVTSVAEAHAILGTDLAKATDDDTFDNDTVKLYSYHPFDRVAKPFKRQPWLGFGHIRAYLPGVSSSSC